MLARTESMAAARVTEARAVALRIVFAEELCDSVALFRGPDRTAPRMRRTVSAAADPFSSS